MKIYLSMNSAPFLSLDCFDVKCKQTSDVCVCIYMQSLRNTNRHTSLCTQLMTSVHATFFFAMFFLQILTNKGDILSSSYS